jgi:hypothetical protein
MKYAVELGSGAMIPSFIYTVSDIEKFIVRIRRHRDENTYHQSLIGMFFK